METKANNFIELFKTVYNGFVVFINYDSITGKFALVIQSKQKSSFNREQIAYYFNFEDVENLIRLLKMIIQALENQKCAIERRNNFFNNETSS